MNRYQKVCLIGAGAVGAVYAKRLHDALGPENFFIIADKSRKARYEKEPLDVNGETCRFHYVTPEEAFSADLILISVKYHALPGAIETIRPFVGPNTVILSLLNGISSEGDVAAVYGEERLLYSFAVSIDATRTENSVVCQNPGRIVFGEKNNEKSDRVLALSGLFTKAGIQHVIADDILHEIWWKFLFNVGINSVSSILNAPYGVFQTCPEAVYCMTAAQKEVIAVANAEGIHLTEEGDLKRVLDLLPNFSPDGETSMLQDVKAKRKTEIGMFSGTVQALGEKHGIKTPVNSLILNMIAVLEKTY